MKKDKKFLLLLLSAVFAFNTAVFAGGGGGGSSSTPDPEPDYDAKDQNRSSYKDMLTPEYYSWSSSSFRDEVNKFIHFARKEKMYHPLQGSSYEVSGRFADSRYSSSTGGYYNHEGTDLDPYSTNVNVYSAIGGTATMVNENTSHALGKHIFVTKSISDDDGYYVGKVSTVYAHLSDTYTYGQGNGVYKGEHIGWTGNTGHSTGEHLHFEIRYYRTGDQGTEKFYRSVQQGPWTSPSQGGYDGYWNPNVGYGYGNPKNHDLFF